MGWLFPTLKELVEAHDDICQSRSLAKAHSDACSGRIVAEAHNRACGFSTNVEREVNND